MKTVRTTMLLIAAGFSLAGCTPAETQFAADLISAASGVTPTSNYNNYRPAPIKTIDYPKPKPIYTPVENYGSSTYNGGASSSTGSDSVYCPPNDDYNAYSCNCHTSSCGVR